MTDTTNGATGEPRDGDVSETSAAPESATERPDAVAPAESAPPATGTVYEPGHEPQPYTAPHYEHEAPAAAAAPAPAAPAAPAASTGSANVPGHVPPAFGGPQHTQPTTPIAGGQAGTDATGTPGAPKQRRVGLGVAAAIVAAALIGGASGAGITTLISNNDGVVSNDSAGVESIVVNDPDSVNQITAVAAKASQSVVTISVSSGQGGGTGSGIILSDDGYVLTNTHVVTLDGATADPSIKVKTSDGRLFDAELVGTDPLSDLAVIKLAGASDLTPLKFADSDELNVGDTAIAIGAPMGLAGTVTNGIVSALNRSIDVASSAAPATPDDGTDEGDNGQNGSESPFDFWNFQGPEGGEQPQQQEGTGQISIPVIQTDAAINPGNSGGALLDSEGNLIGVNVAILSAGGAQTEAGNIGVGFAVPANLAERVAKEIIESGSATHGLLGATVTAAESDAESTVVGALISEVSSGGAAEAAGLKSGDVVTEFNGVPITDQTDLTAQVRALPGGAKAELTYLRGGDSHTASVTLGTFEG
ncbi:trypsin-like peptidase domain-containing protein [Streptomyces sp. ISL-90]|nr:trypsin-like peptidase domain-containing protein [Streptomyces sp. ISL-90]